MNTTLNAIIVHQNTSSALRQEMGLPLTTLANDAIQFACGLNLDDRKLRHLGKMAIEQRRDVIYASWASLTATAPHEYAVVIREMQRVEFATGCVPYAFKNDDPVVLVSTETNEIFFINARGSLDCAAAMVPDLEEGRERAERRIRAAAEAMTNTLHQGTSVLPGMRLEMVAPDFADEPLKAA